MKNCASCGKAHESPFSEELLEIFTALLSEKNDGEREELMITLAQSFASTACRTDDALPESLHGLLDQFEAARLAYDQASFRLGRTLLPLLAKVKSMHGKNSDLSAPLSRDVN